MQHRGEGRIATAIARRDFFTADREVGLWRDSEAQPLGRLLTRLGVATSHPAAFIAALVFTLLWLAIRPETFDWHAVATIATLFMALFIQRATHRDTQALHAKVDELLRSHDGARTELAGEDDKEPEEIEHKRAKERARQAVLKPPRST
jgi:low affinity Fe/Cu permease